VIVAAFKVLKDNGKLYMVHRPERLADILCTMRKHKIEPKTIKMVYPSLGKAPNIVLIEGQKYGGAFLKWEPSLYVHEENGDYTEAINKIYGRE
jgi:tRNA1(Val) A37 N6-methylase TrmN6